MKVKVTYMNKTTEIPVWHFVLILLLAPAVFAFFYYSDKVDETNKITQYQAMALTAMQIECTRNCAVYGVTEDSLVGPVLEYHSTGRHSYIEYLFSWHSVQPNVTLKEHIHVQSDHKWIATLAVDPLWIGSTV